MLWHFARLTIFLDSKGEEDKLDVNGTLRYLQDLGLNIETAEIFVPLEIVQAPSLSELPKDAFVDGWKKHECVSYHTGAQFC